MTSVFIASAAVADTTVIVPYKNTSSTHFLANLVTEHLSKQVTDESFKLKINKNHLLDNLDIN